MVLVACLLQVHMSIAQDLVFHLAHCLLGHERDPSHLFFRQMLQQEVLKQVEGAAAVMCLQAVTQALCLPSLGAHLLWWERPQGLLVCLQGI